MAYGPVTKGDGAFFNLKTGIINTKVLMNIIDRSDNDPLNSAETITVLLITAMIPYE